MKTMEDVKRYMYDIERKLAVLYLKKMTWQNNELGCYFLAQINEKFLNKNGEIDHNVFDINKVYERYNLEYNYLSYFLGKYYKDCPDKEQFTAWFAFSYSYDKYNKLMLSSCPDDRKIGQKLLFLPSDPFNPVKGNDSETQNN